VVRPGCCDVDPLRSLTVVFFFSSRRRHTRSKRDWSSDVCSSDLTRSLAAGLAGARSAGIADLTTAVMEARKSSVDAAIADLSGKIGRASCRERAESTVAAVIIRTKH